MLLSYQTRARARVLPIPIPALVRSSSRFIKVDEKSIQSVFDISEGMDQETRLSVEFFDLYMFFVVVGERSAIVMTTDIENPTFLERQRVRCRDERGGRDDLTKINHIFGAAEDSPLCVL